MGTRPPNEPLNSEQGGSTLWRVGESALGSSTNTRTRVLSRSEAAAQAAVHPLRRG